MKCPNCEATTIGNRIKELRISRNMSQGEMAGVLETSPSAVSMYECGNREPDIATLKSIADYFKVDMNYLTGYTSNETLGELRRFELLTDDSEEVKKFTSLVKEKGLTRKDIALILFTLRVRPGFQKSDFGI